MSNFPEGSTLRLLVERVSEQEREAVKFIREGGPLQVACLLDAIQQTRPESPLAQLIVALAELGLLHALRLSLIEPAAAKVPQPSMN